MYVDREKNPLFLPALFVTLIPGIFLSVLFGFGYLLLVYLLLVIPSVAVLLSVSGIVYGLSRDKRFIGCVFCLVLSVLKLLYPIYLQYRYEHPYVPPIVTRSLTPEERASIEIVNEEIERALHGDNVRRTTK